MLAGEYAVLWGGTALVLGTEPRGWVTAAPSRSVTLAVTGARLTGASSPAGVRWHTAVPSALHFAAWTIDLALRAFQRETTGMTVALSSSPTHDGHKLGLGGSARTCVLVAEAVRGALRATFDTTKLALLAHTEAQGGFGSGADIAGCAAGGLIRYRKSEFAPIAARALAQTLALLPTPDIERLPLPKFPMAYVFAGRAVSTRESIARAKRDDEFVRTSDLHTRTVEDTLTRNGDFQGLATACAELQRGLCALVGTTSERVAQTLALARAFGCAGKQSGAGVGDGCVVFSPDDGVQADFIRAAEQRRFWVQVLRPSTGLRGEVDCPASLRELLDVYA